MATKEPSPSSSVEVTVDMGHPNYWAVANAFHGHTNTQWWLDLGDLLGGRPGWHCELTGEGLLWSFGPFGSSLFNVGAPEDEDDYAAGRYMLYDYEADEEQKFGSTTAMLEWLEANEHRHADHLRNMRESLSDRHWSVVKGMGIGARITHDGHTYIATVPFLSLESTFADDLPTLMSRVRELIAHACDAPPEVAPDIEITARLDAKATAALT